MDKKEIYFRCLRAEDVNARVQKLVAGKGAILLLYKDARCDMAMLDEAVGAFNWKREHSRDNANCTISIWDEDKSQWVSKEDVGTPSNTEAEKGLQVTLLSVQASTGESAGNYILHRSFG